MIMIEDAQTVSAMLDALAEEYDIETTPYSIGGELFSFVSVRDSYALLDRIPPEDFVKDEQMPYWAEIWPAAVTLSEFIVNDLDVRNKTIVELGAGLGMTSVTAARMGADVLSTDYSEEALRFIRLNALKNNASLNAQQLDWRSVRCQERFDMVFAADVLYERVNLLPIVNAVENLLKPDGYAYIADPRRRVAQQFLDLVLENGFSVKSYARNYLRGDHSISLTIYRLSKFRSEDD